MQSDSNIGIFYVIEAIQKIQKLKVFSHVQSLEEFLLTQEDSNSSLLHQGSDRLVSSQQVSSVLKPTTSCNGQQLSTANCSV